MIVDKTTQTPHPRPLSILKWRGVDALPATGRRRQTEGGIIDFPAKKDYTHTVFYPPL